jgi:hypothetical protein
MWMKSQKINKNEKPWSLSFWLGLKLAFKPCKVINLQGLEESLEIGGNGGIVPVIVTSCCHCHVFYNLPYNC